MTASYHGLVQRSAGLRAAWLEGSSTISDSHGDTAPSVSREPYEAWHLPAPLHAWVCVCAAVRHMKPLGQGGQTMWGCHRTPQPAVRTTASDSGMAL